MSVYHLGAMWHMYLGAMLHMYLGAMWHMYLGAIWHIPGRRNARTGNGKLVNYANLILQAYRHM
jgi:hypothetical protein